MCGIVGFVTNKAFVNLKNSFAGMVSSLSHRGPDGSGIFTDDEAGLGLGHSRLAVIDLSDAGHQPMCSDDREIWITYNGEIYNYKKIREKLEKNGFRFRSLTDTEVIINAYRQWGIDCLQHFNGMFAFAIWDRSKQRLFLARDRMGIKPLYYYFKADMFLFASELKALMMFDGFKKEVDKDALPFFLHYQYIPAPSTIFKNTFKLLPGHYLLYNGETLRNESYWELPGIDEHSRSTPIRHDKAINKLDALLTEAVSDRLVSDVPLGALLSGGIDSSLVVALMQKVNSCPTKTYSIGFKESGYNEAHWAKKVARYLGTEHTEFYVTPEEAMGVIPSLSGIYDEPFADSSAIPTLLVSRLARKNVTVALSGDGGDEQFCGYVRYQTTKAMAETFRRFPLKLRQIMAKGLERLPSSWMEKCYLPLRPHLPQHFTITNFSDKWEKLIRILHQTEIRDLYRMTISLWSETEIKKLIGHTPKATQFENAFEETASWPILSRLMYVDQCTYLPDAMLTKVDRASMAESLEIRVPLLDHRVVRFTAKLPETLKYRNGISKYLLKSLLSRYVPREFFDRPKMGFGVPIGQWFRSELKEQLLDYLSTSRLRTEGIFNPVFIEKKIKEHLTGQANHQYRLWTLFVWEMWRENWLSG